MSDAHFIEWGEFSPRYLSDSPNRRTGRRWIDEGEIPGKIIGDRVYVDLARFLAEREKPRAIDPEVAELLRA